MNILPQFIQFLYRGLLSYYSSLPEQYYTLSCMRLGITAVAFDLDGTLYPNYRLNLRLVPFLLRHWRFLAAFGKARDQIRVEQEQSPSPARADFYDYQARLTAERLNAGPEEIQGKIETFIYRGFEPHFLHIALFPHVRELLAELRAAPLKLGILSDFPPETKLKNLGIADYWDAVLCSEKTGALKPAIRPFTELADALGCPPEQILYVGNSYRYDILGAGRAGMKTALIVSRGNYSKAETGAHFTFHDYRQLHDFVLH